VSASHDGQIESPVSCGAFFMGRNLAGSDPDFDRREVRVPVAIVYIESFFSAKQR